MNNDLVNSLLEILNEKHKEKKNTSKIENYKIEIKALDTSKEKGKKLTQDIFIEPSQLTHAEQLAHEVFSLSVHLFLCSCKLFELSWKYLSHHDSA